MSKFKEYAEIFEMLDSQDRLEYLLELSTKSTSLPQQLRSDDRLVRGCMSQIWIDVGLQNNLVKVYYDSDDPNIDKGRTWTLCVPIRPFEIGYKQYKEEIALSIRKK